MPAERPPGAPFCPPFAAARAAKVAKVAAVAPGDAVGPGDGDPGLPDPGLARYIAAAAAAAAALVGSPPTVGQGAHGQ